MKEKHRLAAVMAALFFALGPAPEPIGGQERQETLQLSELLTLTRERSPRLKAALLRVDATRSREAEAGLLPDPTFMIGVAMVLLLLAPWLTGLFTDDPDVLRWGINCLRIMGIGFPMYALGMVLVQAFNGAGDTSTPAILNLFCFWLIQLPLAWWLATTLEFGPDGVFWAIIISESLLTALAVLMFRRGNWKHAEA